MVYDIAITSLSPLGQLYPHIVKPIQYINTMETILLIQLYFNEITYLTGDGYGGSCSINKSYRN